MIGIFIEIGLNHTLEELDGLGIGSQSDDSLLVGGAAASGICAGALDLTLHADGVDLSNLHIEDSLNSFLDLGLVGIDSHLEDVLLISNVSHGLLGDHRTNNDIVNVLHYANTSSILARAA